MFCNLKSENLKNKLFPIATSGTNFQVHKKVQILFCFLKFCRKIWRFFETNLYAAFQTNARIYL